MTEQERLDGILKLREWMRSDTEIGRIVAMVCAAEGQPHIGHLAHFCPDVFDLVYEEMEAMVG